MTAFVAPPPPARRPGEDFGDYFARAEQAREDAYDAFMEAERAKPHHIRRRAGVNLGNQFYSHGHRTQFIEGYVDPMSQTLCGAPAGHWDQTWADTRFPKGRADVTCERCLEIRLTDPKVRK